MIEMNLLPDVKLEYIKSQRARRLAISISVLVCIACIGLLFLVLMANIFQKKHINDLSKDISKESQQLQGQKDINKILTVQNQLQSLSGLHAAKPAASRLYDYMNSVTPTQVAINSFNIDFTAGTANITGTADALATVNQYVDTLKFTTYDSGDNTQDKPKAFSNVVLVGFGISTDAKNTKPASYTINFNFDKAIFDITKTVKLTVPQITTTRSALEKPTDLFEVAPPNTASPTQTNAGAGGR